MFGRFSVKKGGALFAGLFIERDEPAPAARFYFKREQLRHRIATELIAAFAASQARGGIGRLILRVKHLFFLRSARRNHPAAVWACP